MFLIDPNKAPQGAYAMFASQRDHGDEDILRAQDLIEREAIDSVADLARKVGMSPRTFVRRFKQATGNAPLEYIQRVRIELAKRSLEDSRRSLQAIAEQVGYRDPVAFRKVFTRLTGLTPADYRRRYGPLAPPGVIVRPSPTRVRAARRARA
jgi:transcriptional regulator GlxA family with amidase domain